MSNYDDIINLPHPTSTKHPRMSMYQRAAQFAPFAALTGHNAAIMETARFTDQQYELSEHEKAELDNQLYSILTHLHEHPKVTIVHFVPDEKKKGGRYQSITANVNKFDEYNHELILDNDIRIRIPAIISIKTEQK